MSPTFGPGSRARSVFVLLGWRRVAAGATLLGLGLAAALLLIDASPGSESRAAWEPRLIAAAVVIGGGLILLTMGRLPWAVSAVPVVVAAGWLNAVNDGAFAILFIVMAVAWVTWTQPARDGAAMLVLGLLASATYLVNGDASGWLTLSGGLVITWLLIRSLDRQQRLVVELRAAQGKLADEARAAERRRIAREIHDVAAHSLTVTLLQLTGARLALLRANPDSGAITALADAERAGRQSLDDIRRTVGLLADEDSPSSLSPLPTASDIDGLIAEFRGVGLPVDYQQNGDLNQLPETAGLAVYRIVQEALTNIVRHAPSGRAEVSLECGEAVRLSILSAGSAQPPSPVGAGHGLISMRERAELLGGTLAAGPTEAGWLVTCVIPLAGDRPARGMP